LIEPSWLAPYPLAASSAGSWQTRFVVVAVAPVFALPLVRVVLPFVRKAWTMLNPNSVAVVVAAVGIAAAATVSAVGEIVAFATVIVVVVAAAAAAAAD